jgi:hypothetical protein
MKNQEINRFVTRYDQWRNNATSLVYYFPACFRETVPK